MDEAAFARLETELNRGPAAHGWANAKRWTLDRGAEVIRRLFGVDYTRPGVLQWNPMDRRYAVDRQVPGHWRFVIGKDGRTAVGTLRDCMSRFVMPVPPSGRGAATVSEALTNVPRNCRTWRVSR